MSDEKVRELERQLALTPEDEDLRTQWVITKARIGEAMIKTHYKVKYGDKYLSETSWKHPWTSKGSNFKSRADAVKALDSVLKPSKKKAYYKEKKTESAKKADLADVRLVEITTYIVEKDSEFDFVEERTRAELNEIRKQKEELALQEQKLLREAEEKRKKFLKKEEQLIKKLKK